MISQVLNDIKNNSSSIETFKAVSVKFLNSLLSSAQGAFELGDYDRAIEVLIFLDELT